MSDKTTFTHAQIENIILSIAAAALTLKAGYWLAGYLIPYVILLAFGVGCFLVGVSMTKRGYFDIGLEGYDDCEEVFARKSRGTNGANERLH